MESITFTNAWMMKDRLDNCTSKNAGFRGVCGALRREGFGDLHYVEGADLLGDDGEATVDGAHPTDAGFLRLADVLEPVLRPLA